jgi:uncharacterized protein (DUF433 family)
MTCHPHVTLSILERKYVIADTRVSVRRLFEFHLRGVTIETLFKRHPTIPKAHVLSALAFAYDNKELVMFDEEKQIKLF